MSVDSDSLLRGGVTLGAKALAGAVVARLLGASLWTGVAAGTAAALWTIEIDGRSVSFGRERLCAALASRRPARVVDFGCGAGLFGEALTKRYQPTELIGVDIWPPTVKRLQNRASPYTAVLEGDILDLLRGELQGLDGWDLWMFGDCLEHVSREQALAILSMPHPKIIAARIPIGEWPQGAIGGNEAEEHRWSFYPRDLFSVARRVTYFSAETSKRLAKKYNLPLVVDDPSSGVDWDAGGRGCYIANIILE